MNGRRAKAIRKLVYGDTSQRVKRVLVKAKRSDYTAVNAPGSHRAVYQQVKAHWLRFRELPRINRAA